MVGKSSLALVVVLGSSAIAAEMSTRIDPPSGQAASATVGSPAWTRKVGRERDGVELLSDIDQIVGKDRIRAVAGSKFPVGGEGEKYLRVCPAEKLVRRGEEATDRACFYDTDKDGRFDKVGRLSDIGATKLPDPVAYSRVQVPSYDGGGFRQELVYSGLDGKTLRLSYREFANDMARPAFTQDVSFTMQGSYPETVAFRDVKITVLGIDNSGMRYRIEP